MSAQSKPVGTDIFLCVENVHVNYYECPVCGRTTYFRITKQLNWHTKTERISEATYTDIMNEQLLAELN